MDIMTKAVVGNSCRIRSFTQFEIKTRGKELSQHQIDMLVRLGVMIIFCFDKDVTKDELEKLADRFPDGVPLFYIYDEDNVLNEHESPSDNPTKWQYMVEHNVYKLR